MLNTEGSLSDRKRMVVGANEGCTDPAATVGDDVVGLRVVGARVGRRVLGARTIGGDVGDRVVGLKVGNCVLGLLVGDVVVGLLVGVSVVGVFVVGVSVIGASVLRKGCVVGAPEGADEGLALGTRVGEAVKGERVTSKVGLRVSPRIEGERVVASGGSGKKEGEGVASGW